MVGQLYWADGQNEFSQDLTSGVPGLRNLPYLGKIFFSRNKFMTYKTTLLIFLSGQIIE